MGSHVQNLFAVRSSLKSKDAAMPRGGARPGAGRKRRPAAQPMAPFDLVERLAAMPSGPVGRQRRTVLALAAYGAPVSHIAAALGIEPRQLTEFFGTQIYEGGLSPVRMSSGRSGSACERGTAHRACTFAGTLTG